jgi:hypothetical protein
VGYGSHCSTESILKEHWPRKGIGIICKEEIYGTRTLRTTLQQGLQVKECSVQSLRLLSQRCHSGVTVVVQWWYSGVTVVLLTFGAKPPSVVITSGDFRYSRSRHSATQNKSEISIALGKMSVGICAERMRETYDHSIDKMSIADSCISAACMCVPEVLCGGYYRVFYQPFCAQKSVSWSTPARPAEETCWYTVVALLLHCCFTVVTLLLH